MHLYYLFLALGQGDLPLQRGPWVRAAGALPASVSPFDMHLYSCSSPFSCFYPIIPAQISDHSLRSLARASFQIQSRNHNDFQIQHVADIAAIHRGYVKEKNNPSPQGGRAAPPSDFLFLAGETMKSSSRYSNDLTMINLACLRTVEEFLQYKFRNLKLLEEALTHPSYTDSPSYGRLELLGDSVISLAITNHLFLTYPSLDQGQLSLLRAANVSTEKLARSAVKHGLHRFVRHNAAALHETVRDFALAVQGEDELEVYAGAVKAPKVLADIVESVAAAVYVDCGFDLKASWPVFELLLSPWVTLKLLREQPQPVTMLFHYCQKNRKKLSLSYVRKGDSSTANVFVDGQLLGCASSKQKYMAKYNAAKAALLKLSLNQDDVDFEHNQSSEIDNAKNRLYEICGKKKWPKPTFRTEKGIGPAHGKRFVCSVRVETATAALFTQGDAKSRLKDAENSAATIMLLGLQTNKFL